MAAGHRDNAIFWKAESKDSTSYKKMKGGKVFTIEIIEYYQV